MNLYIRLIFIRIAWWFRLSPAPIWGPVTTKLRVLPNDLDIYRHMNNGRYLTVMDIGRSQLIHASGMAKKLKQLGWYPIVAGQTISYRKSLLLWQKYEIETKIIGLDARWCYVSQVFTADQKETTRAIVRIKFLKRSGGSVSNEELVEELGELPIDRVVPEWMTEWSKR